MKQKAISLMLRRMIALGVIQSLIWSVGLSRQAMALLVPRLIAL
jgi:hypothetical protein